MAKSKARGAGPRRPADCDHRRHVRPWPCAGSRAASSRRAGRVLCTQRSTGWPVLSSLPGAHGIVADVSRKEDIHPLALQITALLGGLDVLVNNASSLGPVPLAPLADTECEDLEAALAANLLGPFRLTRALLGALAASAREGRGAVVVNVSSDAAVNAYPNWGAYGASKAALRHLTSIWRLELEAEGIRLLSIDPGDMDTPLHALAVPDADPATLRRPDDAATDIIAAIVAALPMRNARERRRRPCHDRCARAAATTARCPAARRARATARCWQRRARTGSITCTPAIWSWRTTLRRCLRASTACTCVRVGRSKSAWQRDARWSADDVLHWTAVLFGAGDWRTRTEDRAPPPALIAAGDRLALGPLAATIVETLDHPRLVLLRFDATPAMFWNRHRAPRTADPVRASSSSISQPWDVQTPIAGPPVAVEPPSAGFVIDWRTLGRLRERGVGFATLDARGRPVVDRRSVARCAASAGRAVCDPAVDGTRDRADATCAASRHRSRHDGRARARTFGSPARPRCRGHGRCRQPHRAGQHSSASWTRC